MPHHQRQCASKLQLVEIMHAEFVRPRYNFQRSETNVNVMNVIRPPDQKVKWSIMCYLGKKNRNTV